MLWIKEFWTRFPALYFGLILACATLGTHPGLLTAVLIPLGVLCIAPKPYLIRAAALLLLYLPMQLAPPLKGYGEGEIRIERIFPVQRGFVHQGTFSSLKVGRRSGRGTLGSFFSKEPYLVGGKYRVKGVLTQKGRLRLHGKPETIQREWTLARFRQKAQVLFKTHLERKMPNRLSASFLNGLITGVFEERQLKQVFKHLGLAHLLAISGFHFSLIALFFSLLLRPFCSWKIHALCLLLLLTLYFLFLDPAPSIQRAYLGSVIYIGAGLLQRPTSGLNRLGIGLIFSALLTPHYLSSLSFQLSYLATGALIVLFRPIDELFQLLIPERPLKEVTTRSLLFQHLYLLRSWLRKTLALSCAIHLALLPLCLLLFHSFPLHGILYNLFFPLLITIALGGLFISLILESIPPLGQLAHQLNSVYTGWVLELAVDSPLPLKRVYWADSSPLLLSLYLTLLFLLAIEKKNALI